MKKIFYVFAFITAVIFSVFVLDKLFFIKSTHGIVQARAMYYQPRNTIDVVMLGSSHVHYDINNAVLWEKYGIASYDYSAAEQPLWETYHYLKEFCKYQNPCVVVLDLYSPARFKEDYQYYWLNENMAGLRFSINKLQMLFDSAQPDMFENYFPSFATYHTRYKDLSIDDLKAVFEMGKLRNFKGYTPYLNVEGQEEPLLEEDRSGGITLKSEIYLSKIIEYTKKNDIGLFLIVTPYITTDEDELVYNRINEIARERGIEFNSTNYHYENMNLDFETDFCDESHLNYSGSCKFSEYLAEELKKKFDIPDRRNQKGYESWDINAQNMKLYIKGETDSLY